MQHHDCKKSPQTLIVLTQIAKQQVRLKKS